MLLLKIIGFLLLVMLAGTGMTFIFFRVLAWWNLNYEDPKADEYRAWNHDS